MKSVFFRHRRVPPVQRQICQRNMREALDFSPQPFLYEEKVDEIGFTTKAPAPNNVHAGVLDVTWEIYLIRFLRSLVPHERLGVGRLLLRRRRRRRL